MVKSKMLFVLLGNDKTGKTNLQKALIKKLCNKDCDVKLNCNKQFDITHQEIKRKYKTIFFANRSFYEKKTEYKDVDTYFNDHFKDSDIAFVSSHIDKDTEGYDNKGDILKIIKNAKERFYNVTGVFFSNSIKQDASDNKEIAAYNEWDEKLILENPQMQDSKELEEDVKKQLEEIAEYFVFFIANRTSIS